MDIRKLAAEGRADEIKRQLMDLDSQFNFECHRCGKCCMHQDTILFTPRDVFCIARKLGKTTSNVINEYAETYIGAGSHLPVVHMVPRGPDEVCPFLEGNLCAIHDCKPTACALFPLGRVIVNPADLEHFERSQSEVRYILNDIDCGSTEQANTVREWLARFGVPEQDEFFLLWTELIIKLQGMVCDLEAHHASDAALDFFWQVIFIPLYQDYDTSKEFLPQFRKASETLSELCREVSKSLERMEMSDSGK